MVDTTATDTTVDPVTNRLKVAFVLVILALVAGCASSDSGDPAPTDGTPPTDPVAPPTEPLVPPGGLTEHLARCASGIEEWKESAGQLSYPESLVLTVDRTTTYNAAVDISDAPLPPDEVIDVPSGESTAEPITVKCGIAARLVPVGEITVSPDDEWIARSFSPSGVAEWAWDVSTTTMDDKRLRLELQPAQLGDGVPLTTGGEVALVFTDVTVDGTVIDRVSYWFATQWPKLTGVVALLGMAVLGVLGWLGRLRWPWRRDGSAADTTSDGSP